MLTENQLRSYLAWAIHGRKPERRATSSTRKGPPRDAAYMAWMREMPCIACGIEGGSEEIALSKITLQGSEGIELNGFFDALSDPSVFLTAR